MIRGLPFKGQDVGVFGLGKSGMATVVSLAAGGAMVYAYDDNESMREQLVQEKLQNVSVADPVQWNWGQCKTLVLSPGIPLFYPVPHPVVKLAREAGCEIICDNEILFRTCPKAHYIGITGTNGKSTTTSLIHHILARDKQVVQVGGNIGIPVLSLEEMQEDGIFVLEMSSFQLDLLDQMHFHVGIILNITPDHLDRHNTMAEYIEAKKRILNHQSGLDLAVIGVDDQYGIEMVAELKKTASVGHIIPISGRQRQAGGVAVINSVLYDDTGNQAKTISIGNITHLKGEHNAQNIAAAYAAVKHFSVKDEILVEALHSFVGLDHRMQYIGSIEQVAFYNDSKATNADATAKALTISQHIYWILGGQSKAGGITSLDQYFPAIAHAYLIGEAQDEFARTLEGKVPYSNVGTLEKAVQQATQAALRSGHNDPVVLLSPACASFDQFANFMARGTRFCELVELEKAKVKK